LVTKPAVQRPRLLFLCQTLPFPPNGGVTIRTYNIIRQLAVDYDIDLLCFYRRSIAGDIESARRELLRHVRSVDVFPIEQEHSPARMIADHVRSVASRQVYTRFAYARSAFLDAMRARLASAHYALVHVDSMDLSVYVDEVPGAPLVCVHHNIESALLERRAGVEANWLRRRYFSLQAGLMRKEEAKYAPVIASNIVCSRDDATILTQVAPSAPLKIVPNGVDVAEFSNEQGMDRSIVFVGGMTWFPNLDAFEYFAAEIAPRLRSRNVQAPVQWIGRAFERTHATARANAIELTGFVDDVRPYVRDAACFIVPLRMGGGTRLKILSAWSMGKAVVSTSVGCEGLEARDGWNILIRDEPEAFAAAVDSVLADRGLRQTLGENARRTAEDIYSWEVIGRNMRETYLRIIVEHEGAAS
jgi:glycosyltransferase involved in cell wall biosynthesis